MIAPCGGYEFHEYSKTIILKTIYDLLHRYITTSERALSFLESGGDSLTALHLAVACKRNGIILPASVILQSKSITELLDRAELWPTFMLMQRVAPSEPCLNGGFGCQHDCGYSCGRHKRRRITLSLENHAILTKEMRPLGQATIAPESDEATVTEMQLALINGSAKAPGTNIVSFLQTYDAQDIPAMKQAWKDALESESIFRTTFTISTSGVTMRIGDVTPFHWVEVETANEHDYATELKEWPDAELWIGSRFKVVSIDRGLHGGRVSTIAWQVHHALIDGYSASLLYKKVQAALDGRSLQPNASFIWVVGRIHAHNALHWDMNKSFWKDHAASVLLAGKDIVLPMPSLTDSKASVCRKTISLQVSVYRVTAFAHRIGVTVAAVFFSAWALVLSQYCNTDSVAFGIVYSGRDLPIAGIESVIGPLINTLPLCVHVQMSLKAKDFVQNVFHEMVELGLRQFSIPREGFVRTFCSVLACDYSMDPDPQSRIKPLDRSTFEFVSDFPLSISITSHGAFRITYDCNRYSEPDMRLLAEQYYNGILALLESDTCLKSCMDHLMPVHCREGLLLAGNCHLVSTSRQCIRQDLVTLFERTVHKYGHHTALEKGPQKLSYRGLSEMVHRLAAHINRTISPETVICVYADRSINWIIAIYAIIVAGGVYAPLDPKLPVYLRDLNYETAAAEIFIAPYAHQKIHRPTACRSWFSAEEVLMESSTKSMSQSSIPRRIQAMPEAPAYVCFTSGSTGLPKAVLCSHEGLVAFQSDLEVRLFSEPSMRIAQIMSPAFDGSIHEIFSTLSYGSALILAHGTDNLAHLASVDSAILTPSVAKALDPSDYPHLQNLYLVGEAVPQQVNDSWASRVRLYNMYGPTEGTCGATIKHLHSKELVSIGKPNPTTRLYILDRNQCLMPPGSPGEIYIAGIQVARGYIGRPETTAERFLSDSISRYPGELMYRTGDLGYWTSTGEIYLIGRNDRLIKLRGFRVDLDDLEVLARKAVPEAMTVAIVLKGDEIAALLQPRSLDVASSKLKMARYMPHFAVPKYIKAIETVPLTSVGKVDYRAVVSLFDTGDTSTQKVPSLRSPNEKLVESVWRELLSLDEGAEIKADANFLALGADSLSQVLLASRLTTLFNCKISTKMVVEAPTLYDLTQAIANLDETSPDSATVSNIGEFGVSPIEKDWWLQYGIAGDHSSFNVCLAYDLDPNCVDTELLELAWNTVLARYKILRSRYAIRNGQGLIRLYTEHNPRASRLDTIYLRAECNHTFCLDEGSLFSVLISKSQMFVCASHIICDLTAMRVITAEVTCAYNGTPLDQIRRSYEDVTCWHKPTSPASRDFWASYLADHPHPWQQRANELRKARVSYSGRSRVFQLPSILYMQLQDFVSQRGLTFHQLFLAAVSVALHVNRTLDCSATPNKLSSSPLNDSSSHLDIVLGSPSLNRESDDLSVVGLMLEPLPVRIRFPPSTTPNPDLVHETIGQDTAISAFLRSVHLSSQSALAHALPSSHLLDLLSISRTSDSESSPSLPDHPLFDVMVTFHDERHASPLLTLPGLQPRLVWGEGAKFGLMTEFTAVDGEILLLRMEFDEAAYVERTVERVTGLVCAAFRAFVEEQEGDGKGGFEEMMRDLEERAGRVAGLDSGDVEIVDGVLVREVEFGTRVGDLGRVGRGGSEEGIYKDISLEEKQE